MDRIHQAKMRDELSALHGLLEQANEYKEQVKQAQQEVESYKKDLSPERFKELQGEFETLKNNNRIHLNALYGDTVHKLEDIKNLVEDGKTALDMNDPRWTNALNTLSVAGEKPTGELLRTIVSSVSDEPEMLKGLKEIFDSRGLKYQGDLDKKIQSQGLSTEFLRDFSFAAILQSVSLNSLAHQIDKSVSNLGDFGFPPVSGSVLVEKMREGANLPPAKEPDQDEPIEVNPPTSDKLINAFRQGAGLATEPEVLSGENNE